MNDSGDILFAKAGSSISYFLVLDNFSIFSFSCSNSLLLFFLLLVSPSIDTGCDMDPGSTTRDHINF